MGARFAGEELSSEMPQLQLRSLPLFDGTPSSMRRLRAQFVKRFILFQAVREKPWLKQNIHDRPI